MSPPPVYPVTGGAFHILLLRPENVWRYPLSNLLPAPLYQRLVALQAQGKRLEMDIQLQCLYHLLYLLFGYFISDKDSL